MAIDLEQTKGDSPEAKNRRTSKQQTKDNTLNILWENLKQSDNIKQFLLDAAACYIGKSQNLEDYLLRKNWVLSLYM